MSELYLKRDTKRDNGIVKAWAFTDNPARLFMNAGSMIAMVISREPLPLNIEAGAPHQLKRCTAESYQIGDTRYFLENTPRKGIIKITYHE